MYRDVSRDEIYPKLGDFWTRHGFYVSQIQPYYLYGQSYQERIGLRREFYLFLEERDGDTYVNLHLFARITETGMVGGLAAAVIAWPVAIVGGAISYHEYEKDANSLMYYFWSFMEELTNKKSEIPTKPPEPPKTKQFTEERPSTEKLEKLKTNTCKKCGALLPKDWKACPYCGKSL